MNKALLTALLGALLTGGCSDEEVLQATSGDISPNSGVVSARHLNIAPDTFNPEVYDTATGNTSVTSVQITVTVGDRNDEPLTDAHTVYFRSEFGLIDPSCTTSGGSCTVTWTAIRNPFSIAVATDGKVDITAYTAGEEAFNDLNNSGTFDDGETFTDLEEPFVDVDSDFIDLDPSDDFTAGDLTIDVVNPVDPTGNNAAHDPGDGLFNGPGCTHSTLCSPSRSIFIFDQITLNIFYSST